MCEKRLINSKIWSITQIIEDDKDPSVGFPACTVSDKQKSGKPPKKK